MVPASPKYQPLADYLAAQPPDVAEVTLTLPEIEAIIGSALPRGAATQAWWMDGASRSTRWARAWLSAGWHVAKRSLRRLPPSVTFARLASTA